MSLEISLSDAGDLVIRDGSRLWVDSLRFSIGTAQGWNAISTGPWARTGAAGTVSQPLVRDGRKVAIAEVAVDGDVLLARLDLRTEVEGLSCTDSFERSRLAVPTLLLPPDLSFFLVTHGLGRADDPRGGYWPTAQVGSLRVGLPEKAFAPLVLFDEHAALAIAPASQFLTSALLATGQGAARSLHGSVDRLLAGTRIETIMARGKDVADALLRLGDVLLRRGRKQRPAPEASALTSTLGWWNAYGSFFTEPIRPLTEQSLVEIGEDLRRSGVPIGYLGLDLWYPYRQIGQAIRFAPDRDKYPDGLKPISERFKIPMVLHLSALAPDNAYGNDGADPAVYRKIAGELKKQGAIVAWHDWLRTQQHLTPQLRRDPEAADRWFTGMGQALEQNGLALLI